MAYKVTINSKQIREKIENATFKKAQPIAQKRAEEVVKKKKEEFLQEFIEHEITQEILAGPEANYGVSGQNGNLFSFIGFDAGSKPVQDLYKYFEKTIFLSKTFNYDKTSKTFKFKMAYPTIDDIKDVTDLGNYVSDDNGWGEGRSWAISIERGIPGLDRYKFSKDPKILYGKNSNSESRSGTGLQRPNAIHPGAAYKARKYVSELLKILNKK